MRLTHTLAKLLLRPEMSAEGQGPAQELTCPPAIIFSLLLARSSLIALLLLLPVFFVYTVSESEWDTRGDGWLSREND